MARSKRPAARAGLAKTAAGRNRPAAPAQPASAYIIKAPDTNVERHTLAVIVSNEPGVLARVIGLFSGRGYNIESLTVAAVSEDNSISRITVVTTGTPMIIEQIKNQLDRLVPVSDVHDLTAEGPFVEREVALVKVVAKARSHERRESLRMAEIFGANVVDTTT
jgi:acetolactate synthase-1/3 small subunit